ncbi:hypothetical protein BHM03_00004851 [Ensete ventricosum]|nr:hypothetical protein BHM03_00004851 [Ensete ventricosum]
MRKFVIRGGDGRVRSWERRATVGVEKQGRKMAAEKEAAGEQGAAVVGGNNDNAAVRGCGLGLRQEGLLGQIWQREIVAVEVGSVVQAAMLAATEGEKGNGGIGRSDDSGFWGRTTRDSFAAVLVLPTKVISGCGMAMRPRAVAAISRLCKDGCKIFGGEFAAEIGCGLAAGTSRIAALIPIDRNP